MDEQGILQRVFDSTNNALRISGVDAVGPFVGAGGLELIAGTRTLVTTNDVTRLSMANSVTTTFGCSLTLPTFWTSATFGAFFVTSATVASTSIRWRMAIKKHANFIDNISEAFLADNSVTVAAPNVGIVNFINPSPLTNINVTQDVLGSSFSIIISRIGADAADTYTGSAELIGISSTGS